MIKATAPGRCGIVGNPTDMYGGSVLSLSTRERASCTLIEAAEMQITVSDQTQVLHNADDLVLRSGDYLNVARAALSALEVDPKAAAPVPSVDHYRNSDAGGACGFNRHSSQSDGGAAGTSRPAPQPV